MHFILIHGAWQEGSCWEPLANQLTLKGHTVSCPNLPGHGQNVIPLSKVTYELYYKSIEEEIINYKGGKELVLVAHSMSGILAAPLLDEYSERISHLFLIGALVAQAGKSLKDITLSGGQSDIPSLLSINKENNTQSLDPKKVKKAFYHDCIDEIANLAVSKLQAQPMEPLTKCITWKDSGKTVSKRTYIFCENDNIVHPTTQQKILEDYPCKTIKLQSGHFPFLSQTEKMVEILVDF